MLSGAEVCKREGVQLAAHAAAQRGIDDLVLLHARTAAELLR